MLLVVVAPGLRLRDSAMLLINILPAFGLFGSIACLLIGLAS